MKSVSPDKDVFTSTKESKTRKRQQVSEGQKNSDYTEEDLEQRKLKMKVKFRIKSNIMHIIQLTK